MLLLVSVLLQNTFASAGRLNPMPAMVAPRVNYGHGIVQAKAAFEYLEANACDPNEAFKEPEGGCAEFSCSEDSDCDDGNPDTINTCSSGSCQYACATDA